jgi:predicted transcriptional regulator
LKYRSSIIVYFEILAVLAEGSIGPTKLARKVNLSYDRLPPYLDNLVAKGAVRRGTRDGHEEYTLTPMGADLLATLQKALDTLES